MNVKYTLKSLEINKQKNVSHSMQEVRNVGSIEITFTFIILIKS